MGLVLIFKKISMHQNMYYLESVSRHLQKRDLSRFAVIVHLCITAIGFLHYMPIFYLLIEMEKSLF
jgi:hypothetical protein